MLSPGGFVVVDVETTGLVAARDRIVEMAVVRTDASGNVLDEWSTLLNPGGPVGATRIHGINATDVRAAPRFAEVAGELTARLAGRVLVAHNARFDLGFIETEYARAGWSLPAVPYLCTLEASWTYLPELDRRRLSDCCWVCGIALHDAHSALGDARATAQLLATYLDPHTGEPPAPQHTTLPAAAAQVPWPSVPTTPVRAMPRQPRETRQAPAPAGTLWQLLDALPLSSVIEQGAPAVSKAYLELLFEVLEDGVLSEDEASALSEVAKAFSLTREQVEASHRGFLLALAHRIVEDGKVTRDERSLLEGATKALGLSDGVPTAILDEARAALHAGQGRGSQPLPPQWTLGEPLRVGEGVAFTGCEPLVRARLEGSALAAGLRVTGSVSGRTAVLVTDGVNPDTRKAVAARTKGTRTVTPEVFAQLVDYVQPAHQAPATRPVMSAEGVGEAAAPQSVRAEDPPAIRAWAREHGYDVGVRGRISSDVVTAYRAAHQGSRL